MSTKRTTNLITLAVLATVGSTLMAAPAHAASAPMTPDHPIGTTVPPLTSDGVTGLTGMDQTTLADGQTYPLRFREPDPSTGKVLPPAAIGEVQMAVSTSGRTDAGTFLPTIGPKFNNAEQTPVGQVYADSWTVFNNEGSATYTFDFSGLQGGALPAGAVLAFNDVDVCRDGASESAQLSSDVAGSWLDYRADTGSGTPGAVTVDAQTGQVDISSVCPAGANGVTQTFTTNTEISDLTITLNGSSPNTTPMSGLWWAFELPLEAVAPAISMEKFTNDQDVTEAPGPEIVIDSAVAWTYRVGNAGNTHLAEVVVTDDQVDGADIVCGDGGNVIALLAPGESVTCVANGTAIDGPYMNTATAVGVPADSTGAARPDLETVSVSDASWYTGVPAAVTPVVPTDGRPGGELARTGAELWASVGGALALLAGGAAFLLVRRRNA